MFETLKRLYECGRLQKEGLQRAIEKNWLTREEAIKICPSFATEKEN